jgi:hypothetical protein
MINFFVKKKTVNPKLKCPFLVDVVLLQKSFFMYGLEQVSSLYNFVIVLKPIFFSKMLE